MGLLIIVKYDVEIHVQRLNLQFQSTTHYNEYWMTKHKMLGNIAIHVSSNRRIMCGLKHQMFKDLNFING